MNPRLTLLLLSLGFGACTSIPPQAQVSPPGGWGKYEGSIRTEWEPGRKMRLLEDTRYIDPKGMVWLAPKGWSIDGASIPQAFWCTVGGPFEDNYRNASVFHDVACDQRTAHWQDVHRMFYNGMRCSGVSDKKAKVMYAAVYRFGPRWAVPGSDAGPGALAAPLVSSVRRNPTHSEAQRVEDWVQANSPSLEQIEKTTEIPGAPGR
jgi:hypothetical protein